MADDLDTLWQYTTLTSAVQIIKTGDLLATNSQFLNDATEMQIGFHPGKPSRSRLASVLTIAMKSSAC